MTTVADALTLTTLSRIVTQKLNTPELRDVWVVGETSDVATRGGHCYMELLEKDDNGNTLAKARANIWRTTWYPLSSKFSNATGKVLESGMKVRVKVTAEYHALYGFKLTVNDIDPAYTIGDAVRRRNEILARLTAEGVINDNRNLPINLPVQNIAIISAPGAAGYGDFVNQLLTNRLRLRFNIKLFEAVMQGERVPSTVMDALNRIAGDGTPWDIVVIIRGGGATSDMEAFDNYELANHVAQFPIPVIVGIGHERDTTVLDWVGRRVKTPTAAAEWLIASATSCLERLHALAKSLQTGVAELVAGCNEQLSRLETALEFAPSRALERASNRLRQDAMLLADISNRVISPRKSRLEALENKLATVAPFTIEKQRARLDSLGRMLELLSPEATLRRGYSITRLNGVAVTDPATVRPGDFLVTTLANGNITSTVN